MNKKKILLIAIPGIAITVTVALLLFSGPRMKSQPHLRAFESKVNLPPEESVFYTPGEAEKATGTETLSASANRKKGKVYYGYYCVACHGKNGKGNGPVGESYMPAPADLTNAIIREMNTDNLMERSFTGIGHEPVLERVVPEKYKKSIILYVKSDLSE